MTVSREIETCIIELFNDFINFRTIIVKSYLKKSNTPIQDSIQDFIQDFVQLKDITLRRNPSRSRQRFIRFQNITDITIYMFKFMSSFANFQTSRFREIEDSHSGLYYSASQLTIYYRIVFSYLIAFVTSS